ncbi:hypothetical protein AB0M95_33520 [Sphaerisporangium sp. NPDC051017]|uniref:hypothetical protein n=1 Tax=Sphaerisporangium sp. NPDC051017 TaxID=3154636 RepID=UPI00343F176E
MNGAFHEETRADAATRNLCAGVYLDRDFRSTVIQKVYNDTRRRVPPSYGFDLVAVVRHAWRAWALEAIQDFGILATLIMGFALNTPVTLTALSWITLGHLMRTALRNARVLAPLKTKEMADRWLHRGRWGSERELLRVHTRLLRLSLRTSLPLLLVPVVASGLGGRPLGQVVEGAVWLASFIAFWAAGSAAAKRIAINKMHNATSLRAVPHTGRLAAIHAQQEHPCVVYSRPRSAEPDSKDRAVLTPTLFDDLDPFDKPSLFVGSGQPIHRWLPPLAIQLLPKDKNSPVSVGIPFEAHQLVDHLKENLDAMRPEEDAHHPTKLRGFQFRSRLYIAEADVSAANRESLHIHPDSEDLRSIIDHPNKLYHHFLEIVVTDSGELVTSIYLRVTVKGRALSMDFAACALTRTPEEYGIFDAGGRSGWVAVVRSALTGLRDLPLTVGMVWRLVAAPETLARAVRANKGRSHLRRRVPGFGTQPSIRELKSMKWEDATLDKFIIFDYMKIIEQRLLKAAEKFLDGRGLDTSTFEKQASTIINSGVLNMGGTTEVHSSAVGSHSQVRMDVREDANSQ